MVPDCLLGVVPQPIDSRLNETNRYRLQPPCCGSNPRRPLLVTRQSACPRSGLDAARYCIPSAQHGKCSTQIAYLAGNMFSRNAAWSLPIGITLLCAALYLFVNIDGGKLSFLPMRQTPSACSKDSWEACIDVKYRDVSDVYACRRLGTPDLSGLSFRELIRLRSGVTPRLLSTRTRPVTADAGSDRRKYVVPNVVHYIHFGNKLKFGFMQYISYVSVHKFIKPDYIFVHGDTLPLGLWWKRTMAEVPNIYHVFVKGATGVNGKKFFHPTQHSNLLRLYILLGESCLMLFI